MEFRLGGLYLQEMRDLRGEGATLAEVVKHSLKAENMIEIMPMIRIKMKGKL